MLSNLCRIDDYSSFIDSPAFDEVTRGQISNRYAFFCNAEKELRRAIVKQVACFSPHTIFGEMKDNMCRVIRITCANCAKVSYLTSIPTDLHYKSFIINYDSDHSNHPNIPIEVSYYIEQAELCYNSGAYSAAVAMFRAALEQLLFGAGFKDGMLHNKITDAKNAIGTEKAPKWLSQIDDEYLTIIKNLGNSSIHPNNGNIKEQEKLDADLVRQVQIVFQEILYKAFIEPENQRIRKEQLKAAISIKSPKQE